MYDFQELIDALSSNEQSGRICPELIMLFKKNPEALKDPKTFFQKVIPLIRDEEDRTEAIYLWLKLSQEPLPLHQFVSEILPMIPEEYQKAVVPRWFGMPRNKDESDKIILPALTTEHFDFINTENPDEQAIRAIFPKESDRASLVLSWVLNPANDLDEATLIKLIDLLENDFEPFEIMAAWASKSVGIDRFLKILLINKDPIRVDRLVRTWLEIPSNLKSDDEVITVISEINLRPRDFNQELQAVIVNAWLGRSENNENINALIKFLPLIKGIDIKARVLDKFIANLDLHLSAKSLIMMLPVLAEKITQMRSRSRFSSEKIVEQWLVRNASTCSVDDLIKIFMTYPSEGYIDTELGKVWLAYQSKPCDAQRLIKSLHKVAEHESAKNAMGEIAAEWIKENAASCSADELIELIDIFGSNTSYNFLLAKAWIENQSKSCDAQTLIKILRIQLLNTFKLLQPIVYNVFSLAESWVKNNASACTVEELIQISDVFDSITSCYSDLAKIWLENQSKPCDAQTIIKIASRLDYPTKDVVIINWLKSITDTNLRLSAFIELIRHSDSSALFDYANVYDKFKGAGFQDDKIGDLAKGLFPDYEFAQVDCFKAFVRASYLHRELLATQLKALAASLKDSDCCLEILEFGLEKKCLEPLDILLLAKGRLSSNFLSVVELLNFPLHECLNEGCMDEIINFFGPNLPKELTLADLFSYYEVTNGLDKFRQMVKPEIFEKIFLNYQPTEKSPYITREEQSKLVSLGIKPLPQMVILAGYLKSKLPATPSVESSMLIMVKDKNMEDKDPPEWQEAFYEALIAESPASRDTVKIENRQKTIFKFFQMITGQPLAGEESKLYDLFNSLKNELAFLFSRKDGITNYLATLSGIGHGCIANISMKTKMYVYGELFKDIQDRYLYPFYCEKIAVPFLQNSDGGDKLGASATGSEADPLRNSSILQLHLSPPGMIAALSREFYAGGVNYEVGAKAQQIAISPHEVIEFFLGKDSEQLKNFNDNLYDLYEHLPSGESEAAALKKQAEMAAYLLLCKVVSPQSQYQLASTSNALVDHPSFEHIKNHYEEWLKKEPRNLNKPVC